MKLHNDPNPCNTAVIPVNAEDYYRENESVDVDFFRMKDFRKFLIECGFGHLNPDSTPSMIEIKNYRLSKYGRSSFEGNREYQLSSSALAEVIGKSQLVHSTESFVIGFKLDMLNISKDIFI